MANEIITAARAKLSINQNVFTTNESHLIDELVKAVSAGVKRYCGRDFLNTEYDEVYSGSGTPYLHLRNYPILAVARVATDLATALRVTNTSASNQRATVQVTSSGLTLIHVASGVVTTNTLAFATYVTLTSLKNAINALGSGWIATIPDTLFANWASADLRAIQGALACKNVEAMLGIHATELTSYEVDQERGWLLRGLDSQEWLEEGRGAVWIQGRRNYRVIYSAGFYTVPEDVQEAASTWVSALYWQSKRDPSLLTESEVGKVSRTVLWTESGPPLQVRNILKMRRALPNFARGD